MTTSISPVAGSTTTNPTTSDLGPVIADAPATSTTDTYTSAPAATVPTTTAPAAPALPTTTTAGTATAPTTNKPNDKFVKWSTFDSSLPFFKHLKAFFKANIEALKAAKA